MIFDDRALELMVARAARAAVVEALAPMLQQERVGELELVGVGEVARLFDCSTDHVNRLIDAGELGETYDLRTAGAGRAARRVTRVAVAAYLERVRETSNGRQLHAIQASASVPGRQEGAA